jgi:chromosome segregation ATPase
MKTATKVVRVQGATSSPSVFSIVPRVEKMEADLAALPKQPDPRIDTLETSVGSIRSRVQDIDEALQRSVSAAGDIVPQVAAVELKVADHVKALEARIDAAEATINASATAFGDKVQQLAATVAQHEAKLVEAEAQTVDRAAMSVLKRIWTWLTTYEGVF